MTLVDDVNTFNLKNHQVLILKPPSRNDWQTIYSRVGQKGPPPGSDRVKAYNVQKTEKQKFRKVKKTCQMKSDKLQLWIE